MTSTALEMVSHDGFASTIVQTPAGWEVWSAWCAPPLLGCHRATYPDHRTAREHQDAMVASSKPHNGEDVARSTAIEMCAARVPSSPHTHLFHDPECARLYFIGNRDEQFLRLAAHALVLKIDNTCGEPDDQERRAAPRDE